MLRQHIRGMTEITRCEKKSYTSVEDVSISLKRKIVVEGKLKSTDTTSMKKSVDVEIELKSINMTTAYAKRRAVAASVRSREIFPVIINAVEELNRIAGLRAR
jgi:hypothetical protein